MSHLLPELQSQSVRGTMAGHHRLRTQSVQGGRDLRYSDAPRFGSRNEGYAVADRQTAKFGSRNQLAVASGAPLTRCARKNVTVTFHNFFRESAKHSAEIGRQAAVNRRKEFMYKQLAATCLFVSLAFAQGIGTIHGTVTDASGETVPQAKVVAVLEERNTTRSIETDNEGSYAFPSLPVGKYAVHVEALGFKTFSQTGVELTSNENARLDATLEV